MFSSKRNIFEHRIHLSLLSSLSRLSGVDRKTRARRRADQPQRGGTRARWRVGFQHKQGMSNQTLFQPDKTRHDSGCYLLRRPRSSQPKLQRRALTFIFCHVLRFYVLDFRSNRLRRGSTPQEAHVRIRMPCRRVQGKDHAILRSANPSIGSAGGWLQWHPYQLTFLP